MSAIPSSAMCEPVKKIKVVVVNQSLASTSSFTINLDQQQVGFLPKYVIIRQISYVNYPGGTDEGIFLLWSDLTGGYIGAFKIGVQGIALNPMTKIPFTSPLRSITFRVEKSNDLFVGPTGHLAMVLEFIDGVL